MHGKVNSTNLATRWCAQEEVREALEVIWKRPERSEEILVGIIEKNMEVYAFEKRLEERK